MRALPQAIFQRKPWILGETIGYHREEWGKGGRGKDKNEKEETTVKVRFDAGS